jgi:outer membrane protein assembly factor BamB
VVINKNTGNLAFHLTRRIQYGTVVITTSPSNAAIYVNGSSVGTGSYSARYQENSDVRIRASLHGYRDASASVTVTANSTMNRSLTLKPQPIDGRFSVSGSALIRSIVVWNNQLISVDKAGTLRSTNSNGTTNWQISTGNTSNDNSQPVVSGNTVFLSGARDFVGVDAGSGTELFKIVLGRSNAHLFGRSVAVANGDVYYPTDNTIVVYSERTGKVRRRISLPSASNMSALVSGGNLFIADQQGTLYKINAQNGHVTMKIASSAFQPVASAPVLRGNEVFFVGRRGTAVLADVSTGKVLWQRPVDPSRSMAVFTNPVFGNSGVYVFAKGTLFGLSLSNGANLFTPVADVSASPLVDGQSLYYGTSDGKLVRANPSTGLVEAEVSVGSKITTRPVRFGEDIAVGTASGQIVLVYPGTMPAAQ